MDRKECRATIIISGLFIVFGLLLIVRFIPNEIAVQALMGSSTNNVDSRFFPYVVSGFIVLIATLECISATFKFVRLPKETVNPSDEKPGLKDSVKPFVVFVEFVLYALLFEHTGFIISTVIALPAVLFTLGSKNWKHYVGVYALSSVVYVIFTYLLKISL